MTPHIIRLFCEEHLENIVDDGIELKADCPYCGKSKKHWGINLITGKHQCFKCGWKGNFYTLVKYITGRYPNPDKLEQQYMSELSLQELQKIFTPAESAEITEIPDWTENTCKILTEGRLPKLAREYLLTRRISAELAEELGFRIAVSGRYMGRILMPIWENGVVCNFVGRLFMGNGKRYDGPHKGEGYTNKGELLYNLDKIKYNSEIVVVEGIFDAIAIMDRYPTVAILGKTISDIQVEKLLNKAKSVIILMDGGFLEESKEIAEKLLGFVPVSLAILDIGDPNETPGLAVKAVENSVDYYSV